MGVLDSPSPSLGTSPEVVPRQAVCEALSLGREYHRSFQVGNLDITPSNVAIMLFERIHQTFVGLISMNYVGIQFTIL